MLKHIDNTALLLKDMNNTSIHEAKELQRVNEYIYYKRLRNSMDIYDIRLLELMDKD